VRALPCYLEICAFAEKVQVIVPTHGLACDEWKFATRVVPVLAFVRLLGN